MRLGDKPPHPLTTPQQRAIKAAMLVIGILVFGSYILRAGYREMPAFVVGNEIVMSSEIAGTVAEIHRQENETYHRGDALFTIESEAIASQIAAVEHDLEEINRSLSIEQSREGLERRRFELESTIATDENELRACQFEIESLDKLLPGLRDWRDLAAERLRRGEDLRAQDALTATELDDRRRAYFDTESKLQESTARRAMLESRAAQLTVTLRSQHQRLSRITEEPTMFITELELRRRAKEGERDRLRSQSSRLRMVADHDGVVTRILTRPGEYVSSGGPVVTVIRDEQMWIEAYLRADEKRYVRPGDRVEVVGNMSESPLRGRVTKVLPKLEPFPGEPMRLGRPQNFVVLVIALEDADLARGVLSPAQQVTARVRRFAWPGDPEAIAHGVDSSGAK
jgi:multidrug resistance efflux pump